MQANAQGPKTDACICQVSLAYLSRHALGKGGAPCAASIGSDWDQVTVLAPLSAPLPSLLAP